MDWLWYATATAFVIVGIVTSSAAVSLFVKGRHEMWPGRKASAYTGAWLALLSTVALWGGALWLAARV